MEEALKLKKFLAKLNNKQPTLELVQKYSNQIT